MKTTLIIITSLVALCLIGYAYFGGFRKIEVKEVECESEMLVYEDMKGDYANSGKVMDSVYYSLANDYKISTNRGFGLYFDDPDQVAKEDLRSEIGCILEKADYAKSDALSQKFKVKRFDGGTFVEARFPNKGMPSVIVGLMRVYPALDRYLQANGIAQKEGIMEIYDEPNKTIIYRIRK